MSLDTKALVQFDDNMAYVHNLLSLSRSIDSTTTSVVDVGDIQRAAVVMAVSAMDHYVHERVRQGVHEVLAGTRDRTTAFERFPVSMAALLTAKDDVESTWVDGAVRAQHAHRPFQNTSDIADAFRLISAKALWVEVAQEMGTQPQTVKATLKTITDRRNKIAHEADIDPTQPGRRWPMTDDLAANAARYVERVVRTIDACL
jgi:hypothetical protein